MHARRRPGAASAGRAVTGNSPTLPDYLQPGLRIISVGLNPSLPSLRDGYYFSGKRNRFWPALNGSGLLSAQLQPSVAAMQVILERDRIGFTDTVKKPTAGAGDLRAADFRLWVPVLQDKLLALHAEIVWFHGKVAYRNYLRCTGCSDYREAIDWGLQANRIGSAKIFLTPNPSPANAVFSLADLRWWFAQLATVAAADRLRQPFCAAR